MSLNPPPNFKKSIRSSSILSAVLAGMISIAMPPAASGQTTDHPKIGLVLAGGGALGVAHVGVIRVLDEIGVPIDYVAGTSMGAIVGGFYAAGMNADQIEEVLANADWDDLFSDKPPREDRDLRRKVDDLGFLVRYKLGFKDGSLQLPRGAVQGQKLDLLFRSHALEIVDTQDFDELPIPFRAIATDIVTGEEVVLDSGDFVSAIKASFAVSGFFPPVEIDGRLLVDGGLVNNVPVDVVRDMGADIVIVVTLPSALKSKDEIQSAVDVLSQSLEILIGRNEQKQLATLTTDDILITPELGDLGAADFHRALTAVAPGEAAARAVEPRLRQLAARRTGRAVTADNRLRTPLPKAIRIDFVRLINKSPIADEVIMSRIRLQPGDVLDVVALEQDIADVYGLDYFETVTYQVVTEADQTRLVITANEKSAGLQSFRFGLNLENDFDGDSRYNLAVRYQSEALTPLGGEAIVEGLLGDDLGGFATFVQPLDARTRYLVIPSVRYLEEDVSVFRDGNRAAEVRTSTLSADLRLVRQFGEWGAATVGVRRGIGDFDVNIGDPGFADDDFEIGEVSAQFLYDKLDDVNFPQHGAVGLVNFTQSLETLGGDNDFNQLELGGALARSWGRNTGIISIDAGLTTDGEAPIQDLFQLGGFLRLSGFQSKELSGQNFTLGRAIYYREIAKFGPAFLDVPVYAGASLEAGNVYDSISDISVDDVIVAGSLFIGADTFLGPIYIGAGLAEGGNFSAYMFLGRTFGRK